MDIRRSKAGNVVVSEEVIEKMATVAATDVPGVAGVVAKKQSLKGFLKTQHTAKSVIVSLKENQLVIDIFIKVTTGIKVADVCLKVQEAVKESVQNMTGSVVSKVNVHVCEIELKSTSQEK